MRISEKSEQIEKLYFNVWSKQMVGPPYERIPMTKNFRELILMNAQKVFLRTHFYLGNILYLAKILKALLSNKIEFWIYEKSQ